jgi:hypothetical protein
LSDMEEQLVKQPERWQTPSIFREPRDDWCNVRYAKEVKNGGRGCSGRSKWSKERGLRVIATGVGDTERTPLN